MRIGPRKNIFFELLEQHSAKVAQMAEELRDMLTAFDRLEQRQAHIKQLEHECDELARSVFTEMASTFVTPLDKEDLANVAARLDDIADTIDAVGVRLSLYQLAETRADARELSELLVQATAFVAGAIPALRSLSREKQRIVTACRELHRLENESDAVYRRGLGTLLNAPGADPILVLKWKEILDHLELGADRCEDVANVVESIQIKYLVEWPVASG